MIVDYHVSTLFGQAQRYGAPEPLGSPRHYRDATL